MRSEKLSLKKASLETGVKPETVKRWAGSALEKRSGRFAIKKGDRLLRPMKIPTPDGVREIIVRGSRQASVLGSYWSSIQEFLRKGGRFPYCKVPWEIRKGCERRRIPTRHRSRNTPSPRVRRGYQIRANLQKFMMRPRPPKRDPFRACQREAIAERRVGIGAKCSSCGESRPFALCAKSEPRVCAECKFRQEGMRTTERITRREGTTTH